MTTTNVARISFSLVTIFAAKGALAATTTPATKPVITDYARPLSFEPNRGQADKQVDFLAHGARYSLFLSHGEVLMVLQSRVTPLNLTTVHMRPAGGKLSARGEALGELPGKSNYFIGSEPARWHTRIPNYARVRYRSVYPGVDLIYYGNQKQLEYDFVVNPGADPGKVILEFEGAAQAQLNGKGEIMMRMSAGEMWWHKPVAYQQSNGHRRFIACDYVRRGNQRLGFRVAAYDHAEPLIIDPILDYSTYLGGGNADSGNGIAVDEKGNAYMTGQTESPDFPTKNGFDEALKSGKGNAFVTKIDKDGDALVYSTFLGGDGAESGAAIAIDAFGNAYVTGFTTSSNFPIKNAFQQTLKGSQNAFVTKIDKDGDALVYSSYLGGSGNSVFQDLKDEGYGIAVGEHGNAYVTGYTTSPDFPVKNAFQPTLKSSYGNAFVTKVGRDGDALIYSTFLGGSVGEYTAGGIALDNHGHAYVTGGTGSPDFPTKNAFQNHLRSAPPFSGYNAFITKFDADGDALVYSTFLGGSFSDIALAIAVDAHHNAYATGVTYSFDFPTKNAFQSSNNAPGESTNAFVTKLDVDGDALVYSTYLGGSGASMFANDDQGNAIAVDSDGHAYVTGVTVSLDFPTKNAFQQTLKSANGNGFITKFDKDGDALVYSSYLGGTGTGIIVQDEGNGIAVDSKGNAYITGLTISSDFPVKNALQGNLKGGQDAFLTKVTAQ